MEELYSKLSAFRYRIDLHSKSPEQLMRINKQDRILIEIAEGRRVIGSKNYTLLLFITCFLPFLKPSLPQVKESDVKKAKKMQSRLVHEICDYSKIKAKINQIITIKEQISLLR